jgi:hypothetical protein
MVQGTLLDDTPGTTPGVFLCTLSCAATPTPAAPRGRSPQGQVVEYTDGGPPLRFSCNE